MIPWAAYERKEEATLGEVGRPGFFCIVILELARQ